MNKFRPILISCVLSILLSCAASVRISDIKQEPRRFHDKRVTVSGTVTETLTLPILGVGVYQINDGTGKLWIKPNGDVPYKNDRVTVSGELKVGLSISGKNFGLILIESENNQNRP